MCVFGNVRLDERGCVFLGNVWVGVYGVTRVCVCTWICVGRRCLPCVCVYGNVCLGERGCVFWGMFGWLCMG